MGYILWCFQDHDPIGYKGTLPRSFRLVDTQLNTTDAVLHVYEREGDLKYGEVEVGQETVIFDSGRHTSDAFARF